MAEVNLREQDWASLGAVEFGKLLRTVRVQRYSLSQETVAGWLRISPRKYGYVEGGKSKLKPKEIEALRREFSRLDAKDYLPPSNRSINLLTETEFLLHQQAKLQKGKFTDLWLFGSQSLPVLTRKNFQSVWAENLAAKLHYNVVWLLDDEDRFPIELFQLALSGIVDTLKGILKNRSDPAHGKITLYGISIGKPDSFPVFHRFKQSQKLFADHFASYVTAKEPVDFGDQRFRHCRMVLFCGWNRTVVCYLGSHPFASVFLDDISNDPTQPELGWTFLGSEATGKLMAQIRNFESIGADGTIQS